MKYASVLALGMPLTIVLACGGEVFLDVKASDDAGKPKTDSGIQTDASIPSFVCGKVPEVVTTLQADLPHVTKIVVDGSYAVYGATNTGDPKTMRRRLVKVDVMTKQDTVLEDADTARSPDAATFTVTGSRVYYVSDLTAGNHTGGAVVMTTLAGDGYSTVFYPSAQGFDELTSFANEGIYGTATMPVGGPNQAAWYVIPPTTLDHQLYGYANFDAFDSLGKLVNLAAFHNGVIGVDATFKNVRMGFGATKHASIVLAQENYSYREASVSPAASATPSNVYWLGKDGNDELRSAKCTFPVDGDPVCDHKGSALLYRVDFASSQHLAHLSVLDSGAAVFAHRDETGVRAIARMMVAENGIVEPVGGEGITGTIDDVTAITTRGNCIYWAEEGTAGTRIMRVGR